MTDEEIQEIVNRLERAVEFRTAKSHIEQLEFEDRLRVRANRDGCLSFAAAFLHAAIEQPKRTVLSPADFQSVEGHEQLYGDFGFRVTDIQHFEDWENLKTEVERGRKMDVVNDRISLLGCAVIGVFIFVPVFGFIGWLIEWLTG
jgi:hypothetical protein